VRKKAGKVKITKGGYVSYGDVRLKRPSAAFHVKNCEAWLADVLDLPLGAVRLVLPRNDALAPRTMTLGGLRKEWTTEGQP